MKPEDVVEAPQPEPTGPWWKDLGITPTEPTGAEEGSTPSQPMTERERR